MACSYTLCGFDPLISHFVRMAALAKVSGPSNYLNCSSNLTGNYLEKKNNNATACCNAPGCFPVAAAKAEVGPESATQGDRQRRGRWRDGATGGGPAAASRLLRSEVSPAVLPPSTGTSTSPLQRSQALLSVFPHVPPLLFSFCQPLLVCGANPIYLPQRNYMPGCMDVVSLCDAKK